MRKEKTWFEKLGYAYNPFIIKPGFFDDEVMGYDSEIDVLVEKLSQREMMFLEGDFGQGKTTILRYLINEFKGDRRVIYISRNISDRAFNYTKLLKEAASGLGKIFGRKAKGALLIVDETEKINKADCDQIEQFFESGHFHSVLFIDQSFEKARLSDSVKTIIDKNIVQLKPLSEKVAIELVRSRLDGHESLVSDKIIIDVFEKSSQNTRRFLESMEDVCRHAIDNERDTVLEEDVAIL